MLFDIKPRILDYINNPSIYDYFALSWIGVLFLLFFIIALMQVRKRAILSLVLMLFALVLLIISPIAIKIFFDKSVKKVELIDKKVTKLDFSKMLVVEGKIKNISKIDFKKCRIFASIDKIYDNRYKNYINYLKPLRKMSILLDKELKKEEAYPYKMVFKDFNISIEYDLKVYGECY